MAPRPDELDALFPYHVTGLVPVGGSKASRDTEKSRPKRLTRHASIAGAVAHARTLTDAGTPCWIEGNDTATLLEKSRSPATSQRLAGKRQGSR